MAPRGGPTAILELKPGDGIDEAEANRAPLIGFNLGGSRPPLILVRCWSEEVDQYRNLARHLGQDQPIVSAGPPEVVPGRALPLDTEAWADHFTALLGSHLEHDGLILGGWSYSGVVALALGERLAAAGRPPRLVHLIDSTMPIAKPRGDARKRGRFHKFVIQLNKGLERPDPQARKVFFQRYAQKQLRTVADGCREQWAALLARITGGDPPERVHRGWKKDALPPIEPLRHAIALSYLKHRPTNTKLPVALYWTEDSRQKLGDSGLGWTMHTLGAFHAYAVPGTHSGLFDDENVGALAAAMKERTALA